MKESIIVDGTFQQVIVGNTSDINVLNGTTGEALLSKPAAATTVKADTDFATQRLVIVDSDAGVTAQQAATESFATVFSQWQRVAIKGLDPNAVPAEFNNWSYANNAIVGSQNTGSTVGFISPRNVSAAYTFEVLLNSTNTDDDFIGIFLGYVEVNGVCNTLSLVRSAGGNAGRPLFGLYLNFQGYNNTTFPQEVALVAGNFGLKSPDGNVYVDNQEGSPLGGWQAYTTNGGIKIKAVMTEDGKITCSTNNPNEGYVASSQFTFDLASRTDTQQFIGGTRIGYMAMSQPACTWSVLVRPGSREDFIDARTKQIWSWSGTAWVNPSASTLDNYIRPGRHYYNEINGKVFFYNPDTLALVYIASLGNPFATNQQILDGVDGGLLISPAGLKALYTSLHPA